MNTDHSSWAQYDILTHAVKLKVPSMYLLLHGVELLMNSLEMCIKPCHCDNYYKLVLSAETAETAGNIDGLRAN